MKSKILTVVLLSAAWGTVLAQHSGPGEPPEDCPHKAKSAAVSPYAGQQDREIKALSTDEREKLLLGRGMGLARAAELNGFPGPKHVLELSDLLDLSETQRKTAQRLFDEMDGKARALGREIVDREAALDASFSSGTIDQGKLAESVLEIGHLKGQLRLAHLETHLRMHAALNDAQIAAYDRLRGYR